MSKKTKTQVSTVLPVGKDLKKYAGAYLLVLPVVIFYLVFCYKPMYGLIIAFKDFSPGAGIWESDWASNFGMQHFIDFFSSYYFGRVLKNTLTISITSIIIGFPAPIIFALLLNEIRSGKLKRITQTVTYMPHFISLVVACSMVQMFVSDKGIITGIVNFFGLGKSGLSLLSADEFFVPIYVLSEVWQELGWGAIIYLAALSGIDQQLYEAAEIDGAGRWKKMIHVTLPGIMGQIVIMLLLRLGSVMSVGHEKVMLLYNEGIYETADVISTFVYRRGLIDFEWSYSTAVGLFNSIINFVIVVVFNKISKKATEISLW